MANGFLGMTIAAMTAAALLLAISYWRTSSWAPLTAFVIAIVPLVAVILPVLL